jgi:hypothetical protein
MSTDFPFQANSNIDNDVRDTQIQYVGYMRTTLDMENSSADRLLADKEMTYPLMIKKSGTPRYPYLVNSEISGKV